MINENAKYLRKTFIYFFYLMNRNLDYVEK